LLAIGGAVTTIVEVFITAFGLDKYLPVWVFQMMGTGITFVLVIVAVIAFAKKAKLLFIVGGIFLLAFLVNFLGLLSYFHIGG
jgi:hypothetical protein